MLAPHIRDTLHGTDQDVGFVVGVFSFVALAGRLVAGPLADRRGRNWRFSRLRSAEREPTMSPARKAQEREDAPARLRMNRRSHRAFPLCQSA